MASLLKPEASLGLSLATATVVYGIYTAALPNVADARSIDQRNTDLEAAERLAGWTAAGVVAGISLLAKDPTIFIFGSGMVIAMSWWHRHADMVNPLTGKAILGMDVSDFVPGQTQAEKPMEYQSAPSYDVTV